MTAILLVAVLGHGDGTFQTDIIPLPNPGPVCVGAGDFNRDGKLDLAAVNGTNALQVSFQEDRKAWGTLQLQVGAQNYFVRSADIDGDGSDDLIVASLSGGAFVVLSQGGGKFKPAQSLPRTHYARWAAAGDWDGDGLLDLAVAVDGSVRLLGQGVDGVFSFLSSHDIGFQNKPHGVEAADYDGDGKLDLLVAIGDYGVRPLQGHGDGTFAPRPDVKNLGCGHTIAVGDFNADGMADLAAVCDAFADSVEVGLSAGNGTFKKTYNALEGIGYRQCLAIADLDGDKMLDLAVGASAQPAVFVLPGRGDGRFARELRIEPTGDAPSFIVARDLDGDGRTDLVSADPASATLSVFWGQAGARFLQSGIRLSGFGARDLSIGDLDGNGTPDLLVPNSLLPEVRAFLGPVVAAGQTVRRIAVAAPYDSLKTADLDGDGILDLAGKKLVEASALVAFLGRSREAERELLLPVEAVPAGVLIGRIDAGDRLDLAVLASSIWIFTGREGRGFSDARPVPTVGGARTLGLGDFDGDGRTDLAVAALRELAFHFHDETGAFFDGPRLPPPGGKSFRELTTVDLDQDGLADALASESAGSTVYLFRSRGKTFEPLVAGGLDGPGLSLSAGDLDGDGLSDITASTARSVLVILNRGPQGFARPVIYKPGIAPAGNRLADLDLDGALDLVVFNARETVVHLGRSAPAATGFVRGDSNGDSSVDLSDAVAILDGLFRGQALPCADAADANDDGAMDVADPTAVLETLFLGGKALAPPGPAACGQDPTPDALPECASRC